MELLELVEARIEIVVAIVGLVEVIKNIIEKKQLSVYMLLTLVFSYGLSQLIGGPVTTVILNTLVYFGLASLFYRLIVRYVEKLNQKYKQES